MQNYERSPGRPVEFDSNLKEVLPDPETVMIAKNKSSPGWRSFFHHQGVNSVNCKGDVYKAIQIYKSAIPGQGDLALLFQSLIKKHC